MNGIATIKSSIRFGGILAAALIMISTATATSASAAGACPGGDVQICTFKCSGPVTKPVCVDTNCTCSLPKKSDSELSVESAARDPLVNNPPKPSITAGR